MLTATTPMEKAGKKMESPSQAKTLMLTVWTTSCVLTNTKSTIEENPTEITIEEIVQADDADTQPTKSNKTEMVDTSTITLTTITEAEMISKEWLTVITEDTTTTGRLMISAPMISQDTQMTMRPMTITMMTTLATFLI